MRDLIKELINMKNDYSENNLKQLANGFNFELLSIVRDGRLKVKLICKEGHETVKEARKLFNDTCKCLTCCNPNSPKTNIEILTDLGYTLCSDNVNFKKAERITVSCIKGHIKETTLRSILTTKGSCKECAGKYVSEESFKKKIAENNMVILSEYTTLSNGGTLKHLDCGSVFTTKNLSGYYARGEGCAKCFGNVKLTDEELKDFFHTLDYELLEVRGASRRVKIKCIHCDSVTSGRLSNYRHRKLKCGCQRFKGSFLLPSKPTILYYVKINHSTGIYYKIGITQRGVRERFYSEDWENIEVLSTLNYDNLLGAKTLESYFKTEFVDSLYQGDQILNGTKNTEIFTKDVLELDT